MLSVKINSYIIYIVSKGEISPLTMTCSKILSPVNIVYEKETFK
jgi:hypothetical protein